MNEEERQALIQEGRNQALYLLLNIGDENVVHDNWHPDRAQILYEARKEIVKRLRANAPHYPSLGGQWPEEYPDFETYHPEQELRKEAQTLIEKAMSDNITFHSVRGGYGVSNVNFSGLKTDILNEVIPLISQYAREQIIEELESMPRIAEHCTSKRHKHHIYIPWYWEEPYDKYCDVCGEPAAWVSGQNIALCDCHAEDWCRWSDRDGRLHKADTAIRKTWQLLFNEFKKDVRDGNFIPDDFKETK